MEKVRKILSHENGKHLSSRRYPGGGYCYTYKKRVVSGLHRTIRRQFFSNYKPTKKRRGSGSSKELGVRVDKQLTAYARLSSSLSSGKQQRVSGFVKAAINWFQKNEIRPVEGQIKIYSKEKEWATAIDLVAVKKNKLILIEVKTGYSVGASRSQGMMQRNPLKNVKSNQMNHHQLQLAMMDHLLCKEYDVHVDKAVILYLQRDAKSKKHIAKSCIYEKWCDTFEKREEIWNSL